MKTRYASRSGLFLIELILSIFFFMIAAAVVLQLFVKSHLIKENTININHALLYTQNISEVFLANDGELEAVKALYTDQLMDISDLADNAVLLLFDKNWNFTADETNAKYTVLADCRRNSDFSFLNIYINTFSPQYREYIASGEYKSVFLKDGYIYHIEVKKYVPLNLSLHESERIQVLSDESQT